MSEEVNDEGHLRKYLLGELTEAEQQALEERLMTETELFDLLPVAEDELIDDYLGGALSADERGKLESFFLSTPERRRKLSFAMSFRKYVTAEAMAAPEPARVVIAHRSPWWRQAFAAPYFRLAAAAVIVLGLGLGIWRVFFYQSEVAKGMAALAKAYRVERPTEARISGLNYAPLPNTRGSDQPRVNDLSLNRAERILLDEVTEHPGPASHHALGRLYLAERKFDKAIAQFEEAVKGDPNNAQLHSDYGAALLELGKADRVTEDSGKALEELAKSLGHLNRALDLNASLLEALFNRGLVHQQMMLPQQAEEDWKRYLEMDSGSRWADEARQNLVQLEEQKQRISRNKEKILADFLAAFTARDDENAWDIISNNRDALSGRLIWDQLLGAYLNLSLEGQANEAETKLQALLYAGELEFARTGDRFVLDLFGFYKGLGNQDKTKLARARELMRIGHENYGKSKFAEAIAAYANANHVFQAMSDTCESWFSDYWIGYCYKEGTDNQRCSRIFEQLIPQCEKQNYEWLLMRTLFLLSSLQFNLNEYSKAIDYCNRAAGLAAELGDANGLLTSASLLTEYYRYIGNYHQSLSCIQRTLPLLNGGSLNPIQLWRQYAITASALNSSGLYDAAIDYQTQAVQMAQSEDTFSMLCVSYAHLGLIHGKRGNYEEAIRNVRLAYETAKANSDEAVGKKMMAYSSLQMGHLHRQRGNFDTALASYNECIDRYTALAFPTHLYQAHKGRLACYISLHSDSLASDELQVTLNLIEKYRSTILEGDNRNNFSDVEQSVYDLGIDLAYSRLNAPQRAFDYSEASRARSLLDLLSAGGQPPSAELANDIRFQTVSDPLSLSDVQERMPEQVEILQYAVLEHKVLVWAISKGRFSVAEKEVDQQNLSEIVLNYLQSISAASDLNREEATREAEELSRILIEPLATLIDSQKQLCIVPDKILNYLPFASLISADSGKYLVEDHQIVYSPSSSVFVLSSEEASKKRGRGAERILTVGNPRFDRNEFTTLADLPSAEREAAQAAACYKSSCRLTGANATKTQVVTEMKRSDVVHLAVHSVVDDRSPMRSKLVLAKVADDTGDATDGSVLVAREIYQLRLPLTKLVVLSACQTGVDRYYKGEGMISIARPFSVAGVPLVIASLWPVNSDSTAELMISFHKHRKLENVSSVEALRRAQLDMLSKTDERFRRPYYWAPFVVVGGYANF